MEQDFQRKDAESAKREGLNADHVTSQRLIEKEKVFTPKA